MDGSINVKGITGPTKLFKGRGRACCNIALVSKDPADLEAFNKQASIDNPGMDTGFNVEQMGRLAQQMDDHYGGQPELPRQKSEATGYMDMGRATRDAYVMLSQAKSPADIKQQVAKINGVHAQYNLPPVDDAALAKRALGNVRDQGKRRRTPRIGRWRRLRSRPSRTSWKRRRTRSPPS